jgi:hypothetical protein
MLLLMAAVLVLLRMLKRAQMVVEALPRLVWSGHSSNAADLSRHCAPQRERSIRKPCCAHIACLGAQPKV